MPHSHPQHMENGPVSTRLSWTELAAILAFWTFLAMLTASSRIFDPRAEALEGAFVLRELVRADSIRSTTVTFYIWAALTPLVFWFSARYSIERHNWQRRVLFHLAVAFFVAIAVDLLTDWVRYALFPEFVRHRHPFNPLFHIRRLWFLNELITFFAVFAAGVARDYFLRYRDRQAEAANLRTEDAAESALSLQYPSRDRVARRTRSEGRTPHDRAPQ